MIGVREQIAKTLMELMLQIPYKQISIKHICECIPLSRRSFYSYYCNKDSLLESIIIEDFMKNAFPIIKSGMGKKGTRAFFKYIQDKHAFYKAVCAINDGDFLFHSLVKAYGVATDNVNEYAHPVRSDKKKINPNIYRLYTHSGIASIVLYWIREDMAISVKDISRDTALVIELPHSYVRDNYLL